MHSTVQEAAYTSNPPYHLCCPLFILYESGIHLNSNCLSTGLLDTKPTGCALVTWFMFEAFEMISTIKIIQETHG